jgi:hypothetical protein
MEIKLKKFQGIAILFEGCNDKITVIFETDGTKSVYVNDIPKEVYSLPRAKNQKEEDLDIHEYQITVDSPETEVTIIKNFKTWEDFLSEAEKELEEESLL